MQATVGDVVVVKKSGFRGKVIDDEDGLLTVQAGAQRIWAPAHTVEISGSASTGKKTVSKKKKGKKQSFLPSATPSDSKPATPATDSSASSLAALQAKFGKRN
jgi:hypothetical protein